MSTGKFRGFAAALLLFASLFVSSGFDAAQALTARGAWSASTTYAVDDLVTLRGSAWRSRHNANKGKLPGQTSPTSTAADWELFASGFNPLGAWKGTATYQKNDVVLAANGAVYRALRTNVNKTPGLPANTADWAVFVMRGATGAQGVPGPQGPQGPAGPSAVADGTASAPSFKFTSSPDTGMFSPGSGKIALTENGALFLHDIGTDNTALGLDALTGVTTGFGNTAVGHPALVKNTVGNSNVAIGSRALENNVSGDENIAVGYRVLSANSGGSFNVAVGSTSLKANTTGDYNIALGQDALSLNTVGGHNMAIGAGAMFSNVGGGDNIAIGDQALGSIQNGDSNVAIGGGAAINPTSPFSSVFILNPGAAGDTKTIKIGTQGTQTSTFIAGISGVTVANSAAVLIDTTTGQLGTVSSSRRYKEDIHPMGAMSDMLARLRPVSFRYRKPYADGSKPIQYGLIAEEVAEAFPYLAVFNGEGQPETVKYHELPAFLLEGFQEQQKVIATQAERIAVLEAQAEEMADVKARLAAIEAMLQPAVITAASASR